jgi:hypothetical protein
VSSPTVICDAVTPGALAWLAPPGLEPPEPGVVAPVAAGLDELPQAASTNAVAITAATVRTRPAFIRVTEPPPDF